MKLREWRDAQNPRINGRDFAVLIGVDQSTISRIEGGKMWPDRETLEKITLATGGAVTANDFLQIEIPAPSEAAA